MNDFIFEKEMHDDSNYMKVIFEGKEKNNNIDYVKLEKLCNDYFKKDILNFNSYTLVSHIRTIFKEFDESNLIIELKQENKRKYNIKYSNKQLISFSNEEKKQGNNIYIDYSLLGGFKFGMDNVMLDSYSNISGCECIFSKYLSLVYSLKNVEYRVLDRESKLLCEIYNLFYGDYPNFNSKNINTKVQTMVYILSEFGIILSSDYKFSNLNNKKIPHSEKLFDLVGNMKPYGKVEGFSDLIIERKTKDIIKIISDTIKKSKGKELTMECAMKYVSSIMYATRYSLSLGYKTEDICNYLEYAVTSVETGLRVERVLNKKIYQKN